MRYFNFDQPFLNNGEIAKIMQKNTSSFATFTSDAPVAEMLEDIQYNNKGDFQDLLKREFV
jgi:hypothetical protein